MINYRHTFLEINLAHLRHNYLQLKNLVAPNAFFCPMVKANAYGHGDVEVARELAQLGCQWVGVGFIEEAIKLRDAGLDLRILVMGLFEEEGANAILDYDLTPVLSDWRQIDSLSRVVRARKREKIPIHIKFNTGMNRLGFDVKDAEKLHSLLSQQTSLQLEGLCTHLAQGEDAAEPHGRTQLQLEKFAQTTAFFASDLYQHVWNCSGLINSPHRARLGARPGISIYGYLPDIHSRSTIAVRPVMSLKSQVIMYHQLRQGETVSYGGIWQAPHDSLIGVVPVGYGDGYPRSLSNKGVMLFRGRRVPVIGHVCMDYAMIDLSSFNGQSLRPGEEVVIFGQQGNESIWLEELAKILNTISYELMTGIGERVPRKFVR